MLGEEWWLGLVVLLAAEDLAELDPANALAATSESTAVSATLPAISQRLTWCSRRSAASRVCECGLISVVMKGRRGVQPGTELGNDGDREHRAAG